MNPDKRWSLQRRLTLGYALIAGALAAAVAGVGALFLKASVEHELQALVLEELEELELRLDTQVPSAEEFAQMLAVLQGHHLANPLAARLWFDGANGTEVLEAGAPHLLRQDVPARHVAQTQRDGAHRWRTQTLTPKLAVAVVVDGTAQRNMLASYGAVALLLGGIGVCFGLGFGALAAQRTSALLARVAKSARNVRSSRDGAAFEFPDAPRELNEVTDALGTMLTQLASQRERARLVTAGLAHELGAPLQNLLSEIDVALLRNRDAAEYRAVLARQRDELRELSRALENLVTFVALDERAEPNVLERFDLAADLERRVARDQHLAARRGVELDLQTDGEVYVQGEREALGLAAQNLIANAIQWCPAKGHVEVRLRHDGGGVRLTVDDSGPGVPLAQREHIFEPRARGPGAEERRIGFGLGLAIARGAARAHGGELLVDDSPLGGARFELRLPDRRSAARAGTELAASGARDTAAV
ncbi:MAG: hypothetical protein GC161_14830 [Planctomycetaceae bacterium]|nr:hypothetical protein [Planctomycetaceae bacterium]